MPGGIRAVLPVPVPVPAPASRPCAGRGPGPAHKATTRPGEIQSALEMAPRLFNFRPGEKLSSNGDRDYGKTRNALSELGSSEKLSISGSSAIISTFKSLLLLCSFQLNRSWEF